MNHFKGSELWLTPLKIIQRLTTMSLIRARHFNNLLLFCDGSPFSNRLSLHFCCYYSCSSTITTTTIITICTNTTTNIFTNNSITTTRIWNYTITYVVFWGFFLQATLVTISIISGQSSRQVSWAWINFSFFIFFNTYKFFDSIMDAIATDNLLK